MAGRYGDDRNRDRWRDEDRERSSWRAGGQGTSEREDERGFFERAGEEVRSWFRDDDDRRGDDYGSNRSGYDRDRDFSRDGARSSWDRDQYRGSSPQPSRGRDFGREDRSSFGGMAQGGYGRSIGQFGRERDRSEQSKRNFGGFRDEDDFTARRRSHPQSWGEANRGQSSWDQGMSHLGYGDFGGTLGGFGNQRFGSSQDDHYRSWRDRQMAQLDQDYEDYCREREQQFNQDFDSWRQSRQGQGSASTSSASSADTGATPNAGVGTTTSSVTGTAGSGSAIGGQSTGSSPKASDATSSTGTADTGAGSGGGRSGSRSRG
ncbi:MAG: hypothetical protein M3Y43_04575 [Pseudomonadota bacterium]|nr:hypothetical protein [Pseudomonadota bacterium]